MPVLALAIALLVIAEIVAAPISPPESVSVSGCGCGYASVFVSVSVSVSTSGLATGCNLDAWAQHASIASASPL